MEPVNEDKVHTLIKLYMLLNSNQNMEFDQICQWFSATLGCEYPVAAEMLNRRLSHDSINFSNAAKQRRFQLWEVDMTAKEELLILRYENGHSQTPTRDS